MFTKDSPYHWTKLPNREAIQKRISEKLKGRPSPKRQENYRRCAVCDKLCRLPNNRLETFRYCSRECSLSRTAVKGGWNKGLKGFMEGEKNATWKGDKVGYSGLHDWVYRTLGTPTRCLFCGETKKNLQWANKSHEYKRDREDWLSLCAKCHARYDKRSEKLKISWKNQYS